MSVFTRNSKTVISLDFERTSTCSQICTYCYVKNTERMYKSYLPKITENAEFAIKDPALFAETLNNEYRKLINSKQKITEGLHKLPVRLYGSGDYIKEHYEFIKLLDFNFYIISKNLTLNSYQSELLKVSNLPNLTNILLSFDSQNISNYTDVSNFVKQNNITKYKFAFTGLADEFTTIKQTYPVWNIFFNISEKNIEKDKSKLIREQCPCDSGALSSEKSCTKCSKCWRSSTVKNIK